MGVFQKLSSKSLSSEYLYTNTDTSDEEDL
jgi:hypothetical protein